MKIKVSQSCKFSVKNLTLYFLLIFLPCRLNGAKLHSQMKMLVSSKTLHVKNFKPGVSADALPEAIHYNKYIPLVFQLRVPEWSTETLRLNSTLHCNSDSIQPNPLCPVAYHLDRLLSPIADSMRFSKNIYTPTEGWAYFGKFSCEVIEPHFFHLSAHVDELHLYTDKLKKDCPLARNLNPVVKNMTLAAAHHVVMASTKFNSYAPSPATIKQDSNEASLVQMAGFIGLQTAHVLSKYIDTVRWNNAFTQCQSARLSIGLVNSFWLRNALNSVQRTAEMNGYKLSIPVHEYLPHYYKLPLTDCVLGIQTTKKTVLMLRVLIPVMKRDTKYTRFRLTKIPYLVTEGEEKKICEIDSFDPKDDFLVEETLGIPGGKPVVTMAPECFESELCHISEQPRSLVVDPCLKGLMNGSVDHIRDYCSFECYPIENEELLLPIIIKVANNQYSITGSHKTIPINVYCDDHLQRVLDPNKTNGVMQVILPCNCEIRFKAEVYRSSRPCEQPFEYHYLSSVPFKVDFTGSHPTPEAIADKIDSLDSTSNPESKTEKEQENVDTADQTIPASYILPPEGSGVFEASSGIPAVPPASLLTGGSHPPPPSHTGQLVIIWLLLILLLLSNGLLIYVAYVNRLIDLGGIRATLTRWGIGGTTPPRSRLEEDPPSYPGTITSVHHTNGVQSPNVVQENNRNSAASLQSDNTMWPASLNRL